MHQTSPDVPALGHAQKTSPISCDRLFRRLWPTPEAVHLLVIRTPSGFQHIPVASRDEAFMRANEASDNGQEAYFACAEFNTADNRKATNVRSVGGFWLDIDCGEDKAASGKGYATQEQAREAIKDFCTKADLPQVNMIIDSGGGLHVYWLFDSVMPVDEWKASAGKLKTLTAVLGFKADPSRTADATSILRIPGTMNYKYDPPRPVTIRDYNNTLTDPEQMVAAIERAYSKHCPPRSKPSVDRPQVKDHPASSGQDLKSVVIKFNPDEDYDLWIKIGMICYNESHGADWGYEIWDRWSSEGDKYKGPEETSKKWQSFHTVDDEKLTIGTLVYKLKERGIDCQELIGKTRPQFQAVETDAHPLRKYSLIGRLEELQKQVQEQVFVVDQLALRGQFTVFFAGPNTGKTLLTLHGICESITVGRIDADNVYYINVDDNFSGLVDKIKIAERYGFHMLASGFQGFSEAEFENAVRNLIERERNCLGVVIILDTLKKFVDLMNKSSCADFNKLMRNFVMKGGTVIGLAHINKHRDQGGKAVHAGVSDMIDDADCAYILDIIDDNEKEQNRTVEFECKKRRGDARDRVAYRYSRTTGLSYDELFASVAKIDDAERETFQQIHQQASDKLIIDAIQQCIQRGVNKKMEIVKTVATQLPGVSQGAVAAVLDRYTGDNPSMHRWNYNIGERGAKIYTLLTE